MFSKGPQQATLADPFTEHNKSNYSSPNTLQPPKYRTCSVLYFDLRSEENAIQGDAPEGSDTFQWQLCEEIAWAEIG